MKTAWIFAGQGAQSVGMGKDFYDQYPTFRKMMDTPVLDFDLKQLCFEENSLLNNTAYAQSCIFAVSAGMAQLLKEEGLVPEAVLGLSLGEYTAYWCADSFDFEAGLQLTRQRGMLMDRALPEGEGAMAAILMLDEAKIKQACHEASPYGIVEIANYNAPGQIVITGQTQAVLKTMEICLEKGARRTIRLQVSGAFHSSLLQDAAKQLEEVLNQTKIEGPRLPVVSNCTGRFEKEPVRSLLKRQLTSSVYFENSIRMLVEQGFTTFVEIGPGKTCSSFVKKISPEAQTYNVGNVETFKQVVAALKGENHGE